jgi:hypothetical protein
LQNSGRAFEQIAERRQDSHIDLSAEGLSLTTIWSALTVSDHPPPAGTAFAFLPGGGAASWRPVAVRARVPCRSNGRRSSCSLCGRRSKNGSEQEFDESANWRGFELFTFPSVTSAARRLRTAGEECQRCRRISRSSPANVVRPARKISAPPLEPAYSMRVRGLTTLGDAAGEGAGT